MKNPNNALLGTTHKLPLCTPFRTVHTYRVQPVGRPQNADVGHMRIMIITRIVISCSVALTLIGCGWAPSIPWAGVTVPLPHHAGELVYRQKGTHRAMVTLRHDATPKECWLPWRPWARPVNMYYYPGGTNGPQIRMEDQWSEVLLDFVEGKAYLMVRTPDSQVFAGEILSDEVGSSSSSIDGGAWSVKINDRPANRITSLVVATNKGQYIGRIDVAESKGSSLAPVVLRFVPPEESPEQPIRKDEEANKPSDATP